MKFLNKMREITSTYYLKMKNMGVEVRTTEEGEGEEVTPPPSELIERSIETWD